MRSQLKNQRGNFFLPHQDLKNGPLELKVNVIQMSYTEPYCCTIVLKISDHFMHPSKNGTNLFVKFCINFASGQFKNFFTLKLLNAQVIFFNRRLRACLLLIFTATRGHSQKSNSHTFLYTLL